MKKLLSIALITVSLFGCNESFLEIDPVGSITGDKIFNDVNGYTAALSGAYSQFAKYHLEDYGLYGDLRGDNINIASTAYNSPEYHFESQEEEATGAVLRIWENIYANLNNINNVIESRDFLLSNFPQSASIINSGHGQALVLRAMCHFDLANVYAQTYTYAPSASQTGDGAHLGIVVVTKSPYPGEYTARQSLQTTYKQVIQDLTDGIAILKDNPPSAKIYASADAAKALLSRVYLYMHDWDNVILHADEVLKTNKYGLVSGDNYVNMFIKSTQRTTYADIASEVIWQLNLLSNSPGYLTNFYSNELGIRVYPTNAFVHSFEEGDFRKNQFVGSTSFYTLKYGKETATAEALWPVNFKMMRSAELYLNLAEAYYHQQQYTLAADQLAIVRRRAYNNPDLTISYANNPDLLAQIKAERRKELAFENQRIFDIMRYHESLDRGVRDETCNSTTCQLSYPNDKFILPIPRREIDSNPLIQPNPGVNN